MDKNSINTLLECDLFNGADKDAIEKILDCLDYSEKTYDKSEIIFNEGDEAQYIGIVLNGSVQIVKEDFYGNRNLIAIAQEGDIFAEAYVCAGVKRLPVSIIAINNCRILFVNIKSILSKEHTCKFHQLVLNNLLKISASKSIMLNEKIQIISRRTTREKIMSYLFSFAKLNDSFEFDIPLNRQELADFLCVERSAMSAEISKLKKDGKIDCVKNHFKLLDVF